MKYTWAGDTLTATVSDGARIGIVLFTVEVTDPATGAYHVTLKDNVLHSSGPNDENADPTATLTYTITDSDGSHTTGTLNITFDDDAPTAHDDGVNQLNENAPVTVNAFANDVPGADGVNVSTKMDLVAGSLTGHGDVVYNGNGTFTYTPAAGEEGTVTFQYQIVDGDGDPSVAKVTIELQHNSVPIIGIATKSHTNVNEAGLPARVGEAAGSGELAASGGRQRRYKRDGDRLADDLNVQQLDRSSLRDRQGQRSS